jgi:hypothetical protein
MELAIFGMILGLLLLVCKHKHTYNNNCKAPSTLSVKEGKGNCIPLQWQVS